MNAILKAAKKLERIRDTITLVLAEIARTESEFVADQNRRQLSQGKKADNSSMPDYVPNSDKSGSIKLFDTGEFYESIEAIFDEEGIDLVSTDPKSVFFEKYGQVLGLDDQGSKIVAERIKQKLIKRVRDEITIRS